jgi:transposase
VHISKIIRRLLRVPDLVVRSLSFEARGLIIDANPRSRKPRCGRCGRRQPVYDRSPPRLWRHLALGRTSFWLRYAPRRVHCSRCGVRVEEVPWALHLSRFTAEFEEMVAWLAQQMARTAVCKLMGIDWRTVGAILERVVKDRLDPERLNDLYVIGVDEISFRRHHQYVTVGVDHLKKRVVWVGEGKGADTLNRFFAELGPERSNQLTHVTMDMSNAYGASVNAHAPQAQKVYDRFHVQQLANTAVDEVRRAQVRAVAGTQAAHFLKHSRWSLLKNPWNLTLRQGEKLREVQSLNGPLFRAWLMKESLARGLEYRQRARAEEHLNEWRRWASRSRLNPS